MEKCWPVEPVELAGDILHTNATSFYAIVLAGIEVGILEGKQMKEVSTLVLEALQSKLSAKQTTLTSKDYVFPGRAFEAQLIECIKKNVEKPEVVWRTQWILSTRIRP